MRANPRLAVVREVLKERLRQDAKWGEQNHEDSIWLAVLTEEVGEAGKAILQDTFSDIGGNLREELVHSAAVIVAWIEKLDREAAS